MTKTNVYGELYDILVEGRGECTCEIDNILHYLCDYFSTDELTGLLEHIKKEKL